MMDDVAASEVRPLPQSAAIFYDIDGALRSGECPMEPLLLPAVDMVMRLTQRVLSSMHISAKRRTQPWFMSPHCIVPGANAMRPPALLLLCPHVTANVAQQRVRDERVTEINALCIIQRVVRSIHAQNRIRLMRTLLMNKHRQSKRASDMVIARRAHRLRVVQLVTAAQVGHFPITNDPSDAVLCL